MRVWGQLFPKTISLPIFIWGLCLFLFFPTNPIGAEEILLTKLHPHQESFRNKKGVLVTHPKLLDMEIIYIMETNHIQTLDDYARWLKNNISYKKDNKHDIWTAPQETLRKRNGDCEDYTFLNMAVLRLLGYTPKFLALQKPGLGHAICVFQVKGYYYWFDNAKLKKTNTRTLTELANYISTNHKYNQILEWNEAKKGWITLSKAPKEF